MARDAGRAVFIVDETFLDVPPDLVAEVLLHPANVATVWPHVRPERCADAQHPDGGLLAAWEVTGLLDGRFEVWFQPFWEGTLVHHYVRADAARGPRRRWERRHVQRWKRHVTAVKDLLEPTRPTWHLRGGESVRSRVPPV